MLRRKVTTMKVLIVTLFIAFAVVGLNNYKDYGMSWDETAQREIGLKSFNYITGENDELLTFKDKDYGVAFELPLIFLEKLIKAETFREIYLMRHLVTHFLFLISGLFFFLLVRKLTKNNLSAISAVLFLFLHPRIYAHSFYNTKDIPLMCFFIISAYFLQLYIEKHSVKRVLLFAVFVALATNIRVIAAIIPFFLGGYLLFQFTRNKYEAKYLFHLLICILVFSGILILSWPLLWTNPIENLFKVFVNMSKFRWDSIMLYQGEVISSLEIPKTYLPVWHIITTPVFFLMAEFLGLVLFIKLIISDKSKFLKENLKIQLIFQLFVITLPLFAVVVLESVVYDGWRQFYFIYPSLVMFGVLFINYLSVKYKQQARTVLVLIFVPSLLHIITYHPFQQTFFNETFLFKYRNFATSNYEMDYWGTAYGSAIKTILKKDDRESIKVSSDLDPGYLNYLFLEDKYKKRVKWVKIKDADYVITNLRWRYGGFKEFEKQLLDHIETPTGTISITYRTNN